MSAFPSSRRVAFSSLLHLFSFGAGLAFFATNVSAQTTLTFSTESDFNALVANGSTGSVTFSSTSTGVGGEAGRLNSSLTANQARTLYYAEAFDPGSGVIEVSYFFLAEAFSSNANVTRIALGISTNTTDNLSGSSNPLMVRLIKNANDTTATFEVRTAAAGATNTTSVSLVDGHWYRFSASFTANAESTSYSISGALQDFGTSGSVAGTIIATAAGNRNNTTTFFSGSDALDVYAGFMGQNNGGGLIAVDNFTVPTMIPEANALGIPLGVGLFMMVRMGRRKPLVRS